MRRGDLYSLQNEERMKQKMLSMNVFSTLNIRYVPRDSSLTCDTLDLDIQAMLAKPYDSMRNHTAAWYRMATEMGIDCCRADKSL